MPVTFSLPTVLARLADGQATIEATGTTLGDVVAGCMGVAMARASVFGRAPVVYDLETGDLAELPASAGCVGSAEVRPDGTVEYTCSSAAEPSTVRALHPDGTDRVSTSTSCPSSAYASASGAPRKPVPPAMTIFADVTRPAAGRCDMSEPAKSTQHPFQQFRAYRVGLVFERGGLIDCNKTVSGHVSDNHTCHTERQLHACGDLGERLGRQRADRHRHRLAGLQGDRGMARR